jgi:hypothetical protein
MKTLLEIILCLILAVFTFGQNKAQNVPEKAGIIDAAASVFAGNYITNSKTEVNSLSVINNYLRNNITYPEKAMDCCLQGTELVQFTVLPTGDLANIKVVNSICPEIDEEVIRILNTTNGMWTPATQNGTPVEMEKEILIVFHLCSFHLGTDDEYFTKKATNWYKRGNRALFEHNNSVKALKCYNNAMKYKPLEDALLFARGMVKFELDDAEGAKKDWNRMKSLVERGENENNLNLIVENFKGFAGYFEFLK